MRYIKILLILCFGAENLLAQQASVRPNILWIVSEDTSPLMGCYGDTYATTPFIDKLATQGILYENAFAVAPACALSRFALITGTFASDMGTDNMRSEYPIPNFIKFFPRYLREAGYYTTNNSKKDYNTVEQKAAWDVSNAKATYKNRKPGQPFFAVFNLGSTHESRIHRSKPKLKHDPAKVKLPPYHPATTEMKQDWALFYDNIETMDAQVGKILQELEQDGLAENTIVFYYSDHGGVLARSKRAMFDSGTKVPLIIRFPTKFAHLGPGKTGSRTDRLVSFEDFPPSVLHLAGLKTPDFMKGKSFLGPNPGPEKEYVYSYRGRIDERDEFSRSLRNKQFRYIRNYLPNKISGQQTAYQWQAASIVSWENWYKQGKTDEIQSQFWQLKPVEELFDVNADPHNIRNLASEKEYQPVLEKMRDALRVKMLKDKDTGFIPESMKMEISKDGTVYDYARSANYPIERILPLAEQAVSGDVKVLPTLMNSLNDKNALLRYWAATGCAILGSKAESAKNKLIILLNDPQPEVQIAAAYALYKSGNTQLALPILVKTLNADNVFIRLQALSVLDEMNTDAKPVRAAIQKLFDDNTAGKKPEEGVWKLGPDVALASQILRKI